MDMTMYAGSASLPINVAEGVPALLAQLPLLRGFQFSGSASHCCVCVRKLWFGEFVALRESSIMHVQTHYNACVIFGRFGELEIKC